MNWAWALSVSRWMARVSLSTLTNIPTRGCKVRRAAVQAVKGNTRATRQPTAHVSYASSTPHSTLHASRPPRLPASCACTTPHSSCASVHTLRTRALPLLGSSRAGRPCIAMLRTRSPYLFFFY
ncbi:hypothetical protein C8R45DRAFT_1004861 [Mycena sanguinolenta]|nr:hypothetical protein C8R45DRAFT_1004861 [Mycena sanguinolenta]